MSPCSQVTTSIGLLVALASGASADDRSTLKPFVERALTAAGVEKWQEIRAWTLTAKVTDRDEFSRTGVRHIYVQLPDHYRSDFVSTKSFLDDSPVRTSVVVNGRKGWQTLMSETKDLSGAEVDREKESIRTQPTWARDVALLGDPSYQPAAIPETMIGGRHAVGIKLIHREHPPLRLYFDKETTRLLRSERTRKDGQTAETTYSDYRNVGGVQVPRRWTFTTDGNVDHESNVEGVGKVRFKASARPQHRLYELVEFKLADKLDAKLFGKP